MVYRKRRFPIVQAEPHGQCSGNRSWICPPECSDEDLPNEKLFPGGIRVKALFTAGYTDMDNLLAWLLTFGAKTEVPEPAEVRNSIRRTAKALETIYQRS